MDTIPRASLLGLPTELRLTIFEYGLVNAHINLRHRRQRSCEDLRSPWTFLQIDRRTRQEVLPLFYETAVFNLLDGMTAEKLEAWVECVGHEAIAKIRRVHFYCKGRCTMFGLQPEYVPDHHPIFISCLLRYDAIHSTPVY